MSSLSQRKKDKPVRFHELLELMKKIVKKHEKDTVSIKGLKKRDVHHFFHKKDYKHSPLEQIYYSEEIFTKRGCREFLAILKEMAKNGEKKHGNLPLSFDEKKSIMHEAHEFEHLLYLFEKNPDVDSPYLRDRYVALSFMNKKAF